MKLADNSNIFCKFNYVRGVYYNGAEVGQALLYGLWDSRLPTAIQATRGFGHLDSIFNRVVLCKNVEKMFGMVCQKIITADIQ